MWGVISIQMIAESMRTQKMTLKLSIVRKTEGQVKNFGSTNILEVVELWKMST